MKRIFLILSLILPLFSCGNSSLKKPITEELAPDEIRAIMDKEPQFENIYSECSLIRTWITEDNLRLAKYSDITYADFVNSNKKAPSLQENDIAHQKLYPQREILRERADSLIDYYSTIRPDSLISLRFIRKSVRKTILGEYPVFTFSANPLKGTVDQFDFEFYFSPKINGLKDFKTIPSSLIRRGYIKSPLTNEVEVTTSGDLWTDTLTNISTEELIRDYNFMYRITNYLYNGIIWRNIPFSISLIVNHDIPVNDNERDEIIKEVLDPNYKTLYEYSSEIFHQYLKEHHPTLNSLLEDYNSSLLQND